MLPKITQWYSHRDPGSTHSLSCHRERSCFESRDLGLSKPESFDRRARGREQWFAVHRMTVEIRFCVDEMTTVAISNRIIYPLVSPGNLRRFGGRCRCWMNETRSCTRGKCSFFETYPSTYPPKSLLIDSTFTGSVPFENWIVNVSLLRR